MVRHKDWTDSELKKEANIQRKTLKDIQEACP